jgi:hypothetical protein
MVTYKIVERSNVNNEYLPIYYRELFVYTLDNTELTFNLKGFVSYDSLDYAKEHLSNFVHDNVCSLRAVGCPIDSISNYAKDYVIMECYVSEEALIKVEEHIVTSKTIKLIKELN